MPDETKKPDAPKKPAADPATRKYPLNLPDTAFPMRGDLARREPQWVKQWQMALPLHAEFRTMPMLFYVPPLSPVRPNAHAEDNDWFQNIDNARLPLAFLASLFSAGNVEKVRYALRKESAVRTYRRAVTTGDVPIATAIGLLEQADCSRAEAEAIYRMTTLADFQERFVIPPMHREQAIEMLEATGDHKGAAGFAPVARTQRGAL